MSDTDRHAQRMKGAKRIVLKAQEMGWAANRPVTRADWTPDPEMEAPERLAGSYLLTLSTNSRRVKETLPAAAVEKAAAGDIAEVQPILERMVAQFRAKPV